MASPRRSQTAPRFYTLQEVGGGGKGGKGAAATGGDWELIDPEGLGGARDPRRAHAHKNRARGKFIILFPPPPCAEPDVRAPVVPRNICNR